MAVSANVYERRAAVLLSEINRITCELLGDRPDLGSARWNETIDKIGALGLKFERLAADVRRESAIVDSRIAGFSRYIRGDLAYRERQRMQSRQHLFRQAQALVHDIEPALKILKDIMTSPNMGQVAHGLHDLIEEFSKTAENFLQKPHAQHGAVGTVTVSAAEPPEQHLVQQGADILLIFGLLIGAIYTKLKAVPRR